MFIGKIEELNRTFKLLNNVNVILFSVWNDASAEAYKNGELMLIDSTYRNYINGMTEISNELVTLKREADALVEQIKKLKEEVFNIECNPDIQGCSLQRADGYVYQGSVDDKSAETQYFVAGWSENANEIVYERTNLDEVTGVKVEAML